MQDKIYILGISAFYHDSAAALLHNDEIIAASQEERWTRKKHDARFPINSIKFCLKEGGISLGDLSAIVFYDKPLLKFVRLLETYYIFAPKGLISFISAMPIWIKEKLFLKPLINEEFQKLDEKKIKLLFSSHHLSHAASAFFPSPFSDAAILTVDGVGEWATATISYGEKNKINLLKELRFPHSVGMLYSAFTYYLGFRVNSGEYKIMGLSPYGDETSEDVKKYINLIYENILDVKEDGSVYLNQEYFDYSTGLKMLKEEKWERIFGFKKREEKDEIKQHHCNLAFAIQKITENIICKMAKFAKKITSSKHLCLAGGVALNCVANSRILQEKIFENIWIQPSPTDAGGALGAAYATYYIYFGKERKNISDKMKGSFLGPKFSQFENKYNAKYEYFDDFDKLCEKVAEFLSDGKIVGWYQGRCEWGPRALGSRSILADARNKDIQKYLNLKIKFRESFRPFAPSVLYEDVKEYFEWEIPSPYMLFVADIKKERRSKIPENYNKLSLIDKLYFIRSDLPAVTHIDFSARLQTVHKETNPKFWKLLSKFKEKTGYGILINTSFNVRGEPIVCTPEDAYECFMRTDMDYLVIENFLFDKKEQSQLKTTKIYEPD